MADEESALEKLKKHFEDRRILIDSTKFKRNVKENTIEISASIKRPASLSMEDIVSGMCGDKDIISIDW